jgi:hypothetical protein
MYSAVPLAATFRLTEPKDDTIANSFEKGT